MRLHIGCGSVYLDGYLNVDLPGAKTFLASDRPDLVSKWHTFEDRYYVKHPDKTQDVLRRGPLDQEYVCDYFGDFSNLPAAAWSVEEVLARHSFEHLSITEAHRALDAVDEVLKEGGILRLDVPDHEASLRAFKETGDEFWIRHLLGPRRTDHGFHMMSYTRDRLRALVQEHGFIFQSEEPNIHFYPAFCLRFIKPGPRLPYEYVPLPENVGKMVDIGPGTYPHPRASVYVDNDMRNVRRLAEMGKGNILLDDLMKDLETIPTKSFDYAWCSHCLEHVIDPMRACKALSRIAKRGTLVMPSGWKEALTNFEERTHLWQVMPNPDGPPVFIRAGSQLDRLRHIDTMKILSRVFRTGPNQRVTEEGRHLRKWWYRMEPELDVVYHWENECRVQVIA